MSYRQPAPDYAYDNIKRHENTQNLHPESLILVFDNDKKRHHTVVPFPETYEDAKAIAVRMLGKYMAHSQPRVILRCSVRDREGKWVWADIVPENWKATLRQYPEEVGVFELPQLETFLRGQIYFTTGEIKNNGSYQWATINKSSSYNSQTYLIDRPVSYKAAEKAVISKRPYNKSSAPTKFVVFTNDSLSSWRVIPVAAHTDDDLWRSIVPEPGGVLGVYWE